jgi:hypothetical protein
VQLSNPTRYSFRPIIPVNLSTLPPEDPFKSEPQILNRDAPIPIVVPNAIGGGKTPAVPTTPISKQPLSKGKLLPIRPQQKSLLPSSQTEP